MGNVVRMRMIESRRGGKIVASRGCGGPRRRPIPLQPCAASQLLLLLLS